MSLKSYWISVCVIVMCYSYVSSKDDSWDFMKYTQEWSPSICKTNAGFDNLKWKKMPQNTVEFIKTEACKIPSNVSSWVIHGLWPTRKHEELPNFCNNSDKFNPGAIQSILGQMVKYWPNLFVDSPFYEFWEHEWKKHGTCAESLPVLDTQLKFFTMGLTLNRKFDILSDLQKSGITPSNSKIYNLTQIHDALSMYYSPPVSCMMEKETGKQYVAQISICINKSFQPFDCKKMGKSSTTSVKVISDKQLQRSEPETCSSKKPIYYLPLHS